ncbi:MAG: glycine cleavage system aminomethyltransferase GcvT [Paenibacillaceae bacterium]
MGQLKRTPLFPLYEKQGAKTIDFGGWDLPVQFSSIMKEHEAVRTQAGLFDVSHMGEFTVKGEGSLSFLQQLLTNDISKLEDGQALYALMCYTDGGVVDDLLVYKLKEHDYMLVVNASNIDKDFEWLQKHVEDGVVLSNVSDEMSLIALQGPLAERIMGKVCDAPVGTLGSYRFLQNVRVGEAVALVSRTGYTGEDGFEIYTDNESVLKVWELLLEAGAEDGLVAAGLGARDTLRFEARLPLYGQELSSTITPIEAGLGFFVKLDKGDFIGREVLNEQKLHGAPRKLVGIEMIDRGIPRSHYPVYDNDDRQIGEVTTGTQSPTLKTNIGLALVETAFSALGTEVYVEIRGKRLKAVVIKAPFYVRVKK